MNSKFISESHSLEKKMKIKSEVPLIVILSWVSLHDFSGKEIYSYIWFKKIHNV